MRATVRGQSIIEVPESSDEFDGMRERAVDRGVTTLLGTPSNLRRPGL